MAARMEFIQARDRAVKAEKVRRCEVLKKNHGPNAGQTLGDYCECSRCSMGPIYLFADSWRPGDVG